MEAHYARYADLANRSYAQQLTSLENCMFGDSDFYSRGLKSAGWEAEDIIINCPSLQTAWAREHGGPSGELEIMFNQILRSAPDIVYFQDLNHFTPEILHAIRPMVKLIVGQIATPMKPDLDLQPYDLIFSSFPHYVERFRKQGITAYFQPLAFEERVWDALRSVRKDIGCSFVGGISSLHVTSYHLLEMLAKKTPTQFWGYGCETLPAQSLVKVRHHGEAWGMQMMEIMARSLMTINRHGEVAENNANNMRLFEATGAGTLLITDFKDNLHEFFEIGKEIVVFHNAEECSALVNYYLAHPDEAAQIAMAGQMRTLKDHTYKVRMTKTGEILARHLRNYEEKNTFASPDYNRISYNKQAIDKNQITSSMTEAWKDKNIPMRQRALTQQELGMMYAGKPIRPFNTLVESLENLIHANDRVLEIGCSTGYYYEVLEYLLHKPLHYIGVDYSEAMIAMARDYYPKTEFHIADGAHLPFESNTIPVVISSCVLLHVPNYRDHILETGRVANKFVVAHRTPICRQRPTHFIKKFGYEVEMVELIFNEKELIQLFNEAGLDLIRQIEIEESSDDLFSINYIFQKGKQTYLSMSVEKKTSIEEAENLIKAGRLAEGKFALEKLESIADTRVLNDLAVVNHRMGDKQKALQYLLKSVKINSMDRLTLMNLLELGDHISLLEAITELVKAYLAENSNDVEMCDLLEKVQRDRQI